VPLYLPILMDEPDCGSGVPVFFGGVNVYLQQKLALFRKTPRWIDRIFDSRMLLKWAAGRAGMTRAKELGEMTLSMLSGDKGHQAKELLKLITFLTSIEQLDVIHFSNALLLGMARRIKAELDVSLVCTLQDEDIWLDALSEPQRRIAWEILAQRAADVAAFISVSNYYKGSMCERLRIPSDRIHVVYNGINPEGYEQAGLSFNPPVIGYLERQCREKGLGVLVDAFVVLKKKFPDLKLRIAGGKTADDKPFIKKIRLRLTKQKIDADVEFLPNLIRKDRMAFLQSLSILSVPAEHREAFGIYVIEALASGVPVVQPRQGAFPELLEATGGGVLYEPNNPDALATAIETFLLNPDRARKIGKQGRKVVLENFTVDRMAHGVVKILEDIIS